MEITSLWVYLSAAPLFWLTVTVASYIAADRLAAASGRHPLVNPVLIAVAFISALLIATGTSYGTYFEGAQFVHFLLGPATVALAIPMLRNVAVLRANLIPMAAALAVGAVVAMGSAVGLAVLFGLPQEMVAALAPKSVTTGIAIGVAEQIGADPALTVALVIATGIIGAVIVTPLMNLLRIKDYAARGFAVGLAAHGIGTARAFQVSEVAGTFAGLAMGLNALVTALLAPLLMRWLMG